MGVPATTPHLQLAEAVVGRRKRYFRDPWNMDGLVLVSRLAHTSPLVHVDYNWRNIAVRKARRLEIVRLVFFSGTVFIQRRFLLVPFKCLPQFFLSHLFPLSAIKVSALIARENLLDRALYATVVFLLLLYSHALLLLCLLSCFFLFFVLIFVGLAPHPPCKELFILQFHPFHSLSKLFRSELRLYICQSECIKIRTFAIPPVARRLADGYW